eukprot:2979155-Rhodomonas_salina.1
MDRVVPRSSLRTWARAAVQNGESGTVRWVDLYQVGEEEEAGPNDGVEGVSEKRRKARHVEHR